MKHRDAIIDALHRRREAMARAHDFDVNRIAATIRQHEQERKAAAARAVTRRSPSPRQKKGS
jgi:hypothetical protein